MKQKLWRSIIPFIFCIIAGCVNDNEPQGVSLTVGDTLPEFSIVMNTGETVSTSTLRGKTGVIVFFNTDCGDCRQELPVINQLWDAYKDYEDVEIVAISREEGAEEISSYWEENGLSLPWSAQVDRQIYSLFAKSIIPRIYVFDYQGIITASFGDTYLPSLATLMHEIDANRIMTLYNS